MQDEPSANLRPLTSNLGFGFRVSGSGLKIVDQVFFFFFFFFFFPALAVGVYDLGFEAYNLRIFVQG